MEGRKTNRLTEKNYTGFLLEICENLSLIRSVAISYLLVDKYKFSSRVSVNF